MRAPAIAFVDDLKDAGECFRVGCVAAPAASGDSYAAKGSATETRS
jgi:hypothetical protein